MFDLARDWKSMRSYALVAYCNEWTNGAGHVPLWVLDGTVLRCFGSSFPTIWTSDSSLFNLMDARIV